MHAGKKVGKSAQQSVPPKTQTSVISAERKIKIDKKGDQRLAPHSYFHCPDEDGYSGDDETFMSPPPQTRQTDPKNRLFVGEADLSFADSITSKHPGIIPNTIATTYESKPELQRTYPTSFQTHNSNLTQKSLRVVHSVDAQKLHLNPLFMGKKFERIHFNCPHDKSTFKAQTLPPIIKNFFMSASHIQDIGHRIHMALPKPKKGDYNNFYKGYVYDIYDAARFAGYRLVKKRNFSEERFPGYNHKITGQNSSASVTEDLREYIFEKTSLTPAEILKADIADKRAPLSKEFYKTEPELHSTRMCIKEITTDDDSSDYGSENEQEDESDSLANLTDELEAHFEIQAEISRGK